jgi:hypothetical protein
MLKDVPTALTTVMIYFTGQDSSVMQSNVIQPGMFGHFRLHELLRAIAHHDPSFR